ncbi:leucine-rich repeat receptor protein kinase HPCA1-like [Oryza brachyantha]|uniref:non-specific serine/threonine protein kinase n=1 Tax=Oryza brachyantha TaxID=4533 RepID=J3N761_ORYBR|nr:leucine-rich repeat receptor protein kinase HPCA1-like [Oryza brachyantha]
MAHPPTSWRIIHLLVSLIIIHRALIISADTDPQDTSALKGIAASWDNAMSKLSDWVGNDPCGQKWPGVSCIQNRVTSIRLSSFGLSGSLSGDVQSLSELQYLDLSYNNLSGPLPSTIGSLSNLESLSVVGCQFSGDIPKELGQLPKLRFLSLNTNRFNGKIPPSIGNLSNLYWLDLGENHLTGSLPVSDGTNTGLDNLTNALHFHFGDNQLSGTIPSQLFNSNLKLIHLLLDNNNFTGSIPPTLTLLTKLEVLRLDRNYQLTGPVPANINNLTKLQELQLENNKLTGPLPDLTGMDSLYVVSMGNNNFSASNVPTWFTALSALTTLYLENLHITGELPQTLFKLPAIQTLGLRGNNFNGTLNIGSDYSSTLSLIDLQDNQITALTVSGTPYKKNLILVGNPICDQGNSGASYCKTSQQANPAASPYSTHLNCPGLQPTCLSDQYISPNCNCAVPYMGTLHFRSPSFSDLNNDTYFILLEENMKEVFLDKQLPVESIALANPAFDPTNNLEISLKVFPSGKIRFSKEDISYIGFMLNNQTYKPHVPGINYGPYYFIGQSYPFAEKISAPGQTKSNRALVIGVSVGGAFVVVSLLLVFTVFFFMRNRRPNLQPQPRSPSYASWDIKSSSISSPHLQGARVFTFNELKKITNSFSDANDIGTGGYGKVYRGVLPNGQLIAVKRSEQGSLQGTLEFRTEIELLSRVHHKNLVSLVGYCVDQGEQMLVYEYVPNGTLKDSLTGKSGVRLDWRRRLRVVLGAAKGIAYLHELADPPIVHRDIKSSNILLDTNLHTKVSDFGLSKPLNQDARGQVTTQVKGTMGYLDPEYYMTQQLTEKSDVYSFGVLLLEVITARKPLERGRYVVREVKGTADRSKDLCGLHELLDPMLGPTSLAGFEQYVDLALRCVAEAGMDRPPMSEVVTEIEKIMKVAGMNPADSASNSLSYNSRSPRHPYNGESQFDYSGGIPSSSRVEPK